MPVRNWVSHRGASNTFQFFEVHHLGRPHKVHILGRHAFFPKLIEDFREQEVPAKELAPFQRKNVVVSNLNPNKMSSG